eukprot:6073439-Amphidinium_carterae.1
MRLDSLRSGRDALPAEPGSACEGGQAGKAARSGNLSVPHSEFHLMGTKILHTHNIHIRFSVPEEACKAASSWGLNGEM